jgi:transcriptional regulator with XRE-family HTH domain
MNPDWFADRLKELREWAGLSQQSLADRSGMTREGIAQLETRRRKPSWESVIALCQALGVGCDAFTTPPGDRPAQGPGRPRKPPGVACGASGDAGELYRPSPASSAAGASKSGRGKGRGKK